MEPGGQLDLQQLFQAAAAMQNQLMSAQQELADAEVKGTAGNGLVTATVNGQGELIDLTIAPQAVEPGKPEETAQTLSDLVLAAYRNACRVADDLQKETMGPLTASLPGGLPGLGSFGQDSSFDDDDEYDDDEYDDEDEEDEDDDEDDDDGDSGDSGGK